MREERDALDHRLPSLVRLPACSGRPLGRPEARASRCDAPGESVSLRTAADLRH